MSQNQDNDEELYSYLFAVRVALQDSYENESDIIRELKNYLLDTGHNPHTINNKLHGFYQNYGIDIPLHTIEQVSILNNQILNNMLGFMLGPGDFDHYHQANSIDQENADDADDQENTDSADDQENNPNQNQPFEAFPFFNVNMLSNGQTVSLNYNNPQIIGSNFSFNNLFNLPTIPESLSEPQNDSNTHTHMVNLLNTMINGLESGFMMGPPPASFQDVVVTVDENEIDKLGSKKLESNLETDCSICMGHMEKDEMVTELQCSHIFHTNCIEPYLKQYNYKCPVCRAEVGKVKYNI